MIKKWKKKLKVSFVLNKKKNKEKFNGENNINNKNYDNYIHTGLNISDFLIC